MIIVYGDSDIGTCRNKNEDSWVASLPHGLFAVADGIGGRRGGKEASSLVVKMLVEKAERDELFEISQPEGMLQKMIPESIKKFFSYNSTINKKSIITGLNRTIKHINSSVYDKSTRYETLTGMGSTLCCLYVHDNNNAFSINIGDSRIYRYRNSYLTQLTRDHSQVVLIDDKYKQVLTQALGCNKSVNPEITPISLDKGDIYLLCSDGMLSLSSSDILEIIEKPVSLNEKVKYLIEMAKRRGSTDNITVVLMQVYAS